MLSPSELKDRLFYGWVIIAAFFVIGTLAWGVSSSFGVFLKSIAGEFGLTRAATSGVRSINAVFGSGMSITGGWALDRYGPRIIVLLIGLSVGLGLLLTSQTNAAWQLFITYSLFVSVIGATYITVMGTVSRWFDKKRGLALGIASSGSGLGTVVMAPFATYLISRSALPLSGISWSTVTIYTRSTALSSNGRS